MYNSRIFTRFRESNAPHSPRLTPYHPIASSTPDLLSIGINHELFHYQIPADESLLASAFESNESLPTTSANTVTTTSTAFDSSDILDLPLPAIPVKRRDRKSASVAASSYSHSSGTKFHTTKPLSLVAPKEYSSLPISYKSKHRRASLNANTFVPPSNNHHHVSSSYLNNGAQLRAQRAGIAGDIASIRSAVAAAHLGEPRELTASAGENMHYHSSHEKPRYLFGERQQHHNQQPFGGGGGGGVGSDQIYLNKSGWVQVNQRSFDKSPDRTNEKRRLEYTRGLSQLGPSPGARILRTYDDGHSYSNKQSIRIPGNIAHAELNRQPYSRNSKIEELINRSEARRSSIPFKPNYSLDPQISAILNERPGFLPVKRLTDNESPPPITPIISPPPAFQDTKSKPKSNPTTSYHLTVNNQDHRRQPPKIPSPQPPSYSPLSPPHQQPPQVPAKGMVFSRSFEYDNRKSRDFKENFSKSFDYDLSSTTANPPATVIPIQPDKLRTKTFTNLTGVSPNYLTKKETNARGSRSSSRDPSPVYQTPTGTGGNDLETGGFIEPFKTKTRIRNTLSVRPDKFMSLDEQQGRSRRAQFSRLHHESSSSSGSQGFRSLDQSVGNTVNRRLNSCDSGARSGKYKQKNVCICNDIIF